MRAHCLLLATLVPGFHPERRIMVCHYGSVGLYRAHYHAATEAYSVLAGRVPCRHRHQSVNAAMACSARQRES